MIHIHIRIIRNTSTTPLVLYNPDIDKPVADRGKQLKALRSQAVPNRTKGAVYWTIADASAPLTDRRLVGLDALLLRGLSQMSREECHLNVTQLS